jgi:hypothetical protein
VLDVHDDACAKMHALLLAAGTLLQMVEKVPTLCQLDLFIICYFLKLYSIASFICDM